MVMVVVVRVILRRPAQDFRQASQLSAFEQHAQAVRIEGLELVTSMAAGADEADTFALQP